MSFLITAPATTTQEFAEAALATEMRGRSYRALLSSEAFAQRVADALGGSVGAPAVARQIVVLGDSSPAVIEVQVGGRSNDEAVALAGVVARQFTDLVDRIETPQTGGRPAASVSLVSSPAPAVASTGTVTSIAIAAGAAAAAAAALCVGRTLATAGVGRRRRSAYALRSATEVWFDGVGGDVVIVAVAVAVGSCAAAAPTATAVAVAAALALAIAVVATLVLHLAWVLFFAAICANGVLFSAGPLTLRPEYFAAPLLLVSLILNAPRRRAPPGVAIIAAGLAGWVGVGVMASLLAAPDAALSLRMCVQLTVAILVFIPLLRRLPSARFFVVSGSYILGVIAVGAVVWSFVGGETRLRGLAFEYNVMGAMCVGWLGVLLYCSLATRMRLPRNAYLTAVPLTVATILTTTRAAWIGLGVLAFFWIVANVGRRPVAAAIGALGVVMTLMAITVAAPADPTPQADFWYRLQNLTDLVSGTGGYRVDIWTTAVSEINARGVSSLWGSGLLSFSQLHPPDLSGLSPYLSSLWIGVVYDSGWLGAMFFVVALGGIAVVTPRRVYAVPLFLVLALCASFTNIVWFAFPWVFIALVIRAGADERDVTAGAAP
ncbi:MAG: O-antigen ligase family protein [Gordonia polyisoprenivorans]|nr:O-antigen ligase family protein [Gordonia polyisoprenivorans]